MIIAATSDLHGHLPEITPRDILCVVGDITPDCYRMDAERQWKWYQEVYLTWVEGLPCGKVITIAGNHDYCFEQYRPSDTDKHIYLENEGTKLGSVTFWGTPNVPKPIHNIAFYQEPDALLETFRHIPDKLDFLLCHASPYGVNGCGLFGGSTQDIGSPELTKALKNKDISYILCDHIHSGNHVPGLWCGKHIINVSYCDDKKEPAYPLVYIDYSNS